MFRRLLLGVLLHKQLSALQAKMNLSPKASRRARLGIVAATVLYVLMPVDAVPDIFPFLGWIDDLGAIGICSMLWEVFKAKRKPGGRGTSTTAEAPRKLTEAELARTRATTVPPAPRRGATRLPVAYDPAKR